MSRISGLAALAYRLDAILLSPANMARVRANAESSLADHEQGDPCFPDHPNNECLSDFDPNNVLTPEQRALALAALHDVHCAGVEKVVVIPADLTGAAAAADKRLYPALAAAVRWAGILQRARRLEDWALPWFESQMLRFEQECCGAAPPGGAVQSEAGPIDTSWPEYLSARDIADRLRLPREATRKKLERHAVKFPDCYMEPDSGTRRRGEPKRLYRPAEVLHIFRT